jgi:hypothetical protein
VKQPTYETLSDDEDDVQGGALLDPNDPFADPTDFLGSIGGGSSKQKARQECK